MQPHVEVNSKVKGFLPEAKDREEARSLGIHLGRSMVHRYLLELSMQVSRSTSRSMVGAVEEVSGGNRNPFGFNWRSGSGSNPNVRLEQVRNPSHTTTMATGMAVGRAPRQRFRTTATRNKRKTRRKKVLVGERKCAASAGTSSQDIYVGIDLGTTNSAVAMFVDGKAKIVPDAEGNRTIPSVVTYLPDGEVLVGHAALNRMGSDPKNTFYSVKRLMGLTYEEAKAFQSDFPYDIDEDDEGFVVLKCENVSEGVLYPEEVSGEILRHLCATAEANVGPGATVNKAVITVPAYFGEERREATQTAGTIAGIETVKLLREPVSAALAYGLKLEEDETVLVFDFGGGTFDVSILEVGGGAIEVLATSGDPHLGGDDFDLAILAWIEANQAVDDRRVLRNPQALDNLLKEVRRAREELTDAMETTIPLRSMPNGTQIAELPLTRDKMESLCASILKRCALPTQQACWQAGIDLELVQDSLTKDGKKKNKTERSIRPVDHVLMVGGPTRMPMIQKFVENMTGVKPKVRINPDEAVARGAAVQAAILSGDVDGFLVMDVWQAALMRALAKAKQREEKAGSNEANE